MCSMKLSYPVKVTAVTATVGIALIVVLASYFRRRRKRRPRRHLRNEITPSNTTALLSLERPRSRGQGRSPTNLRSPNGEIPGYGAGVATSGRASISSRHHTRTNSTASGSTLDTLVSSNTLMHADTSNYSPEQLCELGMDYLQTAIDHWQDALDQLGDNVDGDEDDEGMDGPTMELYHQLQQLIDRACRIRNIYEQNIFRQVSANAALDAAVVTLTELDLAYENEKRRSRASTVRSLDDDSSDQDSFVSATDVADLSDLEDHQERYQHLAIYEAALLELEHGSIPYRTLRTKMVNCSSDTEFLAKLHCIRIAMQEIFSDEKVRQWFGDSGRQMLTDLLLWGDRDPEDFEDAYDALLAYASNRDNWPSMEEELRGRGVKVLSFYDIVIEFILFDAFDDLENPPSSVTTVVQNRWLSNGFKETALATAVWSVLKAKRRMLKVPKGFISHFYAISEHISPVLAWGFLGPPSDLKDLCLFFKEQVLGFMTDMFSFTRVRYTTVEHLSEDILRLSKERIAIASERLASS